MINNAVLTGRLTRDPELKHTSGGIAIANMSLAVNRSFKNANGEQEVDFVNLVAFRKTAETMANHLHKGSLIGIEGRIQTRNYENQQGQKVYVTEIVVNNFTFLESKKQASNNNQGYGQANTQVNNSGVSNDGFNSNKDPFANNGEPIEISDSDLPF